MIVYFGTSSKRVNSTAVPTNLTQYSALIKTPSTIENPVLELSTFNADWNAAYIPIYGRYYFITACTAVSNNVFRYSLTVDVLATYAAQIKASSLFVERSESDGNIRLKDETWTHTEGEPTLVTSATEIGGVSSSGTFIIQTVASGSNAVAGGNSMYAVSATTLNSLITELFNTEFYGDGVVDDTTKLYFNPFQYITSCRWFPIAFTGNTTPIKFGWWTSSFGGVPVSQTSTTLSATVVMPAALDWTSYDPEWSRFTMYLPGIGDIEIDPVFCGKNLNVSFHVDFATGSCNAKVRCNGADVASATGQWGIDIQLTQLSSNPANLSTTVFAGINSVTGGMLQAGVTSIGINDMNTGEQIGSTVLGTVYQSIRGLMAMFGKSETFTQNVKNSMQPQLSLAGANGNRSYLTNNLTILLTWKHYDRYYDTTDCFGSPCRMKKTLSTISGYTECKNASLSISGATSTELAAIKTSLEGGFYLE